MSNERAPVGAPVCWGRQFEDGNDECNNCNYKTSCRPATMEMYQSVRRSLPMATPTLPQPQPRFGGYQAPIVPMQAPPLPQPTMQMPHSFGRTPTMPLPTAQAQQPHAPAGWNTPVAFLNRPGPQVQQTPPFPWWQYQGESTSQRLGKNVALSMGRAFFGTLLEFFTNWTWPG